MNDFEAVYIGSRHDTTPLKMLSIKKWIYIDALPNKKAGFEEDHYSKKSYYLDDVVEEFKKVGFNLQQHNEKEMMMLFNHDHKCVIYFIMLYFQNVVHYN